MADEIKSNDQEEVIAADSPVAETPAPSAPEPTAELEPTPESEPAPEPESAKSESTLKPLPKPKAVEPLPEEASDGKGKEPKSGATPASVAASLQNYINQLMADALDDAERNRIRFLADAYRKQLLNQPSQNTAQTQIEDFKKVVEAGAPKTGDESPEVEEPNEENPEPEKNGETEPKDSSTQSDQAPETVPGDMPVASNGAAPAKLPADKKVPKIAGEISDVPAPEETQPEKKFSPNNPYPGSEAEETKPKTAESQERPLPPTRELEEPPRMFSQERTELTKEAKTQAVLKGAGLSAADVEAENFTQLEKERREAEMIQRSAQTAAAIGESTQLEESAKTAEKNAKSMPTSASMISDEILAATIIGVMGLKDIIDTALFGFDGAFIGIMSGAFFIVIAVTLRNMMKNKRQSSSILIAILLFLEIIPIVALVPVSVGLFYVFRYESLANKALSKLPIKIPA